MNQLARAVGEGRITMDEFEQRSNDIMRAATRRDLVPLFADIPARGTQELKVYSQGDLERARAAARKPRLATALIGTIGLNVAAISVGVAGTGAGGAAVGGVVTLLALVPVLWILLYVAKVGPENWSTPSARQMERQACGKSSRPRRHSAQSRKPSNPRCGRSAASRQASSRARP